MKATTCDGTGVIIPDDTPTTGPYRHQYCDEARPIAERYLRELDEIHTEAASEFQSKLNRLREEARKVLAQLPDEPS